MKLRTNRLQRRTEHAVRTEARSADRRRRRGSAAAVPSSHPDQVSVSYQRLTCREVCGTFLLSQICHTKKKKITLGTYAFNRWSRNCRSSFDFCVFRVITVPDSVVRAHARHDCQQPDKTKRYDVRYDTNGRAEILVAFCKR